MSIVPAKSRNARAFTLLEIMLAVGILAMMAMAIYRFVQSNVTALRLSAETTAADAQYDAFREFLTAQLQSLPGGSGALGGDTLKVNDRSRDELRWTTSAGPGVLTRYAGGDYIVTLRLLPESEKSDVLDLGLSRKQKTDSALSEIQDSWVPLLQNVRGIQIRYFDPRVNVWLPRWSDTITLPRLVRVVIERNDSTAPWEAIIALGRTPL